MDTTGPSGDGATVPPYAFKAAAVAWFDSGWPVFPTSVPTGDDHNKKPLVVKFCPGEHNPYPTREQIERWADGRQFGWANVGLRMPPGYMGIDVDQYGEKCGGDELRRLEQTLGQLPPTCVVTSRDADEVSGIRLFRVPKGLKFKGQPPGCESIEIIQPHHRFVQAPPSLHWTGNRYKSYDQRAELNDANGLPARVADETFGPEDVAELPDEWVRFLADGAADDKEPLARLKDAEVWAWLDARNEPDGPMCAQMSDVVLPATARLAESGARNAHDPTVAAVMAVVNAARDGHTGVHTALRLLRNGYLTATLVDRADPRGDALKDWEPKVTSAVRRVVGELESVGAEPEAQCYCGQVAQMQAADAAGEWMETAREACALEDLQEFALTDQEWDNPPQTPPTAYGAFGGPTPLFYPFGVHWLQGESESGKTWVAECVARDYLRDGHRVVFLDYEHNRANAVERLHALGATKDEFRRFYYFDADDIESQKLALYAEHFALLIVDGVSSALAAFGQGGMEQAERIVKWVDHLPRQFASSIMIDHVTKSKDNRNGMAYGSFAKKAVVTGSSWEVECVEPFGRGVNGVISLKCQKDKPGFLAEYRKKTVMIQVRSDAETGAMSLTSGFVFADDAKPETIEQAFEALWAKGCRQELSARQLQTKMKDVWKGYGNDKRSEYLAKWVKWCGTRGE